MSVYNVDSQMKETADCEKSEARQSGGIRGTYAAGNARDNAFNQKSSTQHHPESTSTQASDSTDSSPTTTISTIDSSSLPDPSPNSSPESPVAIRPLCSFASLGFGVHTLDDLTMSDFAQDPPPRPVNYERPMTSPSPRKPRNAKGLALKLTSDESSPLPSQISAPASPSFVKPAIPKARKKPSILSLQTSATSTINARLANNPPQSPGCMRTTSIRHHHSSPQLMPSPDPRGFNAPDGGMQLPPFERCRTSGLSSTFRRPSALKESSTIGADSTIQEEESPIRTQMATRSGADIRGDIFDAPASQEDAKSPGYPEGPVVIYEPNIYLYLEPTVQEASQFDVIVNVAQEVKNPFRLAEEQERERKQSEELMSTGNNTSLDQRDLDEREEMAVPDTAASAASFATAFEIQPSGTTTPRTSGLNEPEYIHIPWEHNTDIAKDLMGLCEIIDARAKEGKKVLVHCQQGASRSASLIIAYGLYMSPDLSVNDAYHAAQAKSRWISPNMKLMYALQDFQKEVEIKKQISGSFKSRSGRSPTKHRTTLSADAIEYSPKEPPKTAPLPSDRDAANQSRSSRPASPRLRGNSTPGYRDVSPGPHSAPSGYSWDASFDLSSKPSPTAQSPLRGGKHSLSHDAQRPRFPFPPPDSGFACQANSGFGSHRSSHTSPGTRCPPGEGQAGTNFPSLVGVDSIQRHFTSKFMDDVPQTPALWSPRIKEFTGDPINQTLSFPSLSRDVAHPGSSIMSPRATEFSLNPFHPAATLTSQQPISGFSFGGPEPLSLTLSPRDDPRSPPTKGEAPIIRSIDDVL